jgi:hypothetical protein
MKTVWHCSNPSSPALGGTAAHAPAANKRPRRRNRFLFSAHGQTAKHPSVQLHLGKHWADHSLLFPKAQTSQNPSKQTTGEATGAANSLIPPRKSQRTTTTTAAKTYPNMKHNIKDIHEYETEEGDHTGTHAREVAGRVAWERKATPPSSAQAGSVTIIVARTCQARNKDRRTHLNA